MAFEVGWVGIEPTTYGYKLPWRRSSKVKLAQVRGVASGSLGSDLPSLGTRFGTRFPTGHDPRWEIQRLFAMKRVRGFESHQPLATKPGKRPGFRLEEPHQLRACSSPSRGSGPRTIESDGPASREVETMDRRPDQGERDHDESPSRNLARPCRGHRSPWLAPPIGLLGALLQHLRRDPGDGGPAPGRPRGSCARRAVRREPRALDLPVHRGPPREAREAA
jgi:hypothetical protein